MQDFNISRTLNRFQTAVIQPLKRVIGPTDKKTEAVSKRLSGNFETAPETIVDRTLRKLEELEAPPDSKQFQQKLEQLHEQLKFVDSPEFQEKRSQLSDAIKTIQSKIKTGKDPSKITLHQSNLQFRRTELALLDKFAEMKETCQIMLTQTAKPQRGYQARSLASIQKFVEESRVPTQEEAAQIQNLTRREVPLPKRSLSREIKTIGRLIQQQAKNIFKPKAKEAEVPPEVLRARERYQQAQTEAPSKLEPPKRRPLRRNKTV